MQSVSRREFIATSAVAAAGALASDTPATTSESQLDTNAILREAGIGTSGSTLIDDLRALAISCGAIRIEDHNGVVWEREELCDQ